MLLERLNKLEMNPQIEIIIIEGKILSKDLRSCSRGSGIYAWVECDSDGNPLSVLYVGKSGAGVKRRCKEHINGWIENKKVNERNFKEVKRVFIEGKRLIVFSRNSSSVNVFGIEVYINDAEESAANMILEPILNPLKKAQIQSKVKALKQSFPCVARNAEI